LYATSGSTGEPKMVALSNRAILFDIGRQTNDLYLGPDDRFDSLFSYAFSASLATTFGALLNGAEVHCYDPQHNITALPAWLADHRITVSTMTVSMLRHLCLLGSRARTLSALRLLSVGGEAIHSADVEAFRSVFPTSCVLQNAMASTETRTYAQYFVPPTGPVESPVPIGLPVAGKEVLLLDENGTPVPPGCDGEIAVRSRYLANGYANDAQRTAIKFQPQEDGLVLYRTGDRGRFRPDGCLVFLGRTDSQAKIRGHRVELDHVAHILELHPEVRTSVVVTFADSGGNDQLIAYVVAHMDCQPAQKPLRDFLRTQLPEYAVPSVFIFLPELPLNANFKVDRRSLPKPAPFVTIHEDVPASSETIEVLRNIWKTVLHCSDVADDDSFLDLGGDSLNAVRVLVATHERFGWDLPPDTLHRFPTLRLFADCVEGAMQNDPGGEAVVVFNARGAGCPLFFAPGLNGSAFGYQHLAAHLESLHPAYGLNIRSWFTTSDVSVESMAANYVVEIERVIPAGGKVIVAGHSFGGTIAFEVASQLRKRGIVDPLPVIIDMPAVNAPGMQAPTIPRQLLDVLRNLPAWSAQEAAHFDPRAFLLRGYGQLRRLWRTLGGRPTRELDPLIYFGEMNLPEAYQTFLTAMYRAMHSYVPGRYEGKIILLRAKVPTLFRSRHLTMGWETVAAGGLEVNSIPGRHDDCVLEFHGRDLAAVLVHCAAAFEAKDPSRSLSLAASA
jgi:thioesterase domain-containing protein/acyl carrier protein